MRRLLLLRHAKAERGHPGLDDHDRALEPRGFDDAGLIGTYLARHGLRPDLAAVSTARRTRQTWDKVQAHFPAPPPLREEPRLYDADAGRILDVIRDTPPAVGTLLVVGHNPGLHEAAVELVATGDVGLRERLHEHFPTSALAVIDFPVDGWHEIHPRGGRLERYLTPKLLGLPAD